MTIAVLGANGQLGRKTIEAILARGTAADLVVAAESFESYLGRQL